MNNKVFLFKAVLLKRKKNYGGNNDFFENNNFDVLPFELFRVKFKQFQLPLNQTN